MGSVVSAGGTSVIPPQNVVSIGNSTTGTTRTTIYTVPTGRTLYVTGVVMSTTAGTATIYIQVGASNSTVLFAVLPDDSNLPITGSGDAPLFAAASGEVVSIYLGSGGGGTNGYAYLSGYLL